LSQQDARFGLAVGRGSDSDAVVRRTRGRCYARLSGFRAGPPFARKCYNVGDVGANPVGFWLDGRKSWNAHPPSAAMAAAP
jgi:hypothetical protein